MHLARESVQPGPVGEVPLGGEAGREQEVARVGGAAVLGLDGPAGAGLVEVGGYDARVEGDVFFDVEDFVYMVEVFTELCVAGVFLAPGPVLLNSQR